VVPRFIEASLQKRAPVIFGDGKQSRDFTFIANVVQANLLAMQAPHVAGEVFNIACGESVDLLTVLHLVAEFSSQAIAPEFQAPRAGDVRHSLADISKARRMLGYQPVTTLRDGLQQTVAYFCQRRASR
jgi:nucleoside-diphosphate-sugar epimerase